MEPVWEVKIQQDLKAMPPKRAVSLDCLPEEARREGIRWLRRLFNRMDEGNPILGL